MARLPATLLALVVLAAGCGGDDDEDGGGSPEPAAAATTSEDARVEGPDGAAIVKVTTELLDAKNGEDPCFAIVASDYAESLGGQEGCARKMGPIATGPLDTITAAGATGEDTGEAQVESSDGSEKRTIKFAKTVSGDWRIDGLTPP